jgi:hypothetical protein
VDGGVIQSLSSLLTGDHFVAQREVAKAIVAVSKCNALCVEVGETQVSALLQALTFSLPVWLSRSLSIYLSITASLSVLCIYFCFAFYYHYHFYYHHFLLFYYYHCAAQVLHHLITALESPGFPEVQRHALDAIKGLSEAQNNKSRIVQLNGLSILMKLVRGISWSSFCNGAATNPQRRA